MIDFLNILLIALCLVISYQDFKYRQISLFLIILFIISSIIKSILTDGYFNTFLNFLFVSLYLLLILFSLKLFYSFKRKIIDSMIGWGDILFILGLGLLLPPEIFIYFTTFGFLSTYLLTLFLNRKSKEVPLAGYLSLLLSIYIIVL